MQSTTAICPSLFNATTAQDGILSRIRLPAGLITASQCQLICEIVDQFGNSEVQITNRANLQIRTSAALSENALLDLQDCGLASSQASTDGLRNIMASPAAGIDPTAFVNTTPLVKAWNFYLLQHPELSILSNKFSVCFDGGESINVSDRPNDICFKAMRRLSEAEAEVHFNLQLGSEKVAGILIPYSQIIAVLAALTEVYRAYTEQKLGQDSQNLRSRPPRLRELLNDLGVEKYLDLVAEKLDYSLKPSLLAHFPQWDRGTKEPRIYEYGHLGVHNQKQSGLAYVGVVTPLGRLTTAQLLGLVELAKQYGGGALRLTPWQNLLLTDIAKVNIEKVTNSILNLGLSISPTHPYAAIAACSGITGCKSAHTDTQADAKAIAIYLEKLIQLEAPINLHFSGCEKSCVQHHPSDIALVGQDSATYKIYIGDGDIDFGRELYAEYMVDQLPQLMERLINIYQSQRQPEQSFREFVNQRDLQYLRQELQEVISHA